MLSLSEDGVKVARERRGWISWNIEDGNLNNLFTLYRTLHFYIPSWMRISKSGVKENKCKA